MDYLTGYLTGFWLQVTGFWSQVTLKELAALGLLTAWLCLWGLRETTIYLHLLLRELQELREHHPGLSDEDVAWHKQYKRDKAIDEILDRAERKTAGGN